MMRLQTRMNLRITRIQMMIITWTLQSRDAVYDQIGDLEDHVKDIQDDLLQLNNKETPNAEEIENARREKISKQERYPNKLS